MATRPSAPRRASRGLASGSHALRRPRDAHGPYTLAIDIGGSHLKVAVVDRDGTLVDERITIDTPQPAPPRDVIRLLLELAAPLPAYDRISVGFPGVVKQGRILTAPNLGTDAWHRFPLAATLARRLDKPVRVLNDAEVQGLAVIRGRGLECVLTLGTGFGSALYSDGALAPHLELGQHPVRNNRTYDQYIGAAAFTAIGRKKWNRRLSRVIDIVTTLINYDRLYLGGGNATRVDIALPRNVEIVSNIAGIVGGALLWSPALDPYFNAVRPIAGQRRGKSNRSGK